MKTESEKLNHYSRIIPAIIPNNKQDLLDFFLLWSDIPCILHIDIPHNEHFLVSLGMDDVREIFTYCINPIQVHVMSTVMPEFVLDRKLDVHSLVLHDDLYTRIQNNYSWILERTFVFLVKHDTVSILDSVDGVQIMTIDTIGEQGKPFSTLKGEYVKHFRDRHEQMYIQIDGGVNDEVVNKFKDTVDGFVVGSYIGKSEFPVDVLVYLENLLNLFE